MKTKIDFTILGGCFKVRVIPKSSKCSIVLETDECGKHWLRLYIKEPAEKGKANQAVIKLLSRVMDVPSSKIRIKSGTRSRDKIISILT